MSFLRYWEMYRNDVVGERARLCSRALAHHSDDSPVGYSLAGCSPALPASASPTGTYSPTNKCRCQAINRQRLDHRSRGPLGISFQRRPRALSTPPFCPTTGGSSDLPYLQSRTSMGIGGNFNLSQRGKFGLSLTRMFSAKKEALCGLLNVQRIGAVIVN